MSVANERNCNNTNSARVIMNKTYNYIIMKATRSRVYVIQMKHTEINQFFAP